MAHDASSLPLVFVNLDRDAERRARLEAELARLNLQGERLNAVWWADLPPAEQGALYSAQLNRNQYYKPLVNGEKGCYASHIQAWRQLLASDAPAMVVLEDDVRLDDRLADGIAAIVALDIPWDMVKLLGRRREKVRSQRPLLPEVALVAYQRVPSMTAGYVISRAGAAKLLATRVPFGRPIDVDLRFWWENDLRILGTVPSLLILDETSLVSSIWAEPPRVPLRQKLRKFGMKWRLSLGNARHRRQQRPL
ncbi:glycosyltransferase family 25 protein [Pantoea sp. 18069]|uniref:glycosyltransferase family 25 protein n=1 Tax=Pantoea sp. 18069 TaxID=2681415 RepID=UPI00135B81E4|nr:glycosyltransferase family 25 protein [Pantoea sp. 18069]